MSNGNVIPRKFEKIRGKMLIKTNMDEQGDLVEVFKKDGSYHELNLRTGIHCWANLSMIRRKESFEVLEVIK